MAVRLPPHLRSRDPVLLAPRAGLHYLGVDDLCWTRVRCGRGFRYLDDEGATIRPPGRDRLQGLAAPPAWENVRYSPDPLAYLQVVGIDDAGRRQYRYHDAYRALCDDLKFERLRHFGRALVPLRAFVAEHLANGSASADTAVAAVLRTIDAGLLRIGNEQSATDGHYGATTLDRDHFSEEGYVCLEYKSKGGKPRTVMIEDEQLATVLDGLAGHDDPRLFTYIDESGEVRTVTAAMVNRTIAEVAGPCFSAKDFRTWGGSAVALEARARGRSPLHSIDEAADALGNTRAVARNSYVHPAVTESPDELIQRAWRGSRRSSTLERRESALLKVIAHTE